MTTDSSSTLPNAIPEHPLEKSDYERLSNFRYRLRRFLRISEDLCAAHAVTSLQYQLLLQIRGFPGREWATVGELAERLQARHNSVVGLIDRCENAGLVERKSGSRDRRQVEIVLSPKGRKLLEELAALHQPELHWLRNALTEGKAGLFD